LVTEGGTFESRSVLVQAALSVLKWNNIADEIGFVHYEAQSDSLLTPHSWKDNTFDTLPRRPGPDPCIFFLFLVWLRDPNLVNPIRLGPNKSELGPHHQRPAQPTRQQSRRDPSPAGQGQSKPTTACGGGYAMRIL